MNNVAYIDSHEGELIDLSLFRDETITSVIRTNVDSGARFTFKRATSVPLITDVVNLVNYFSTFYPA